MFESDAGRDLRNKYNKMTSISAATGKGRHKQAMAGVGEAGALLAQGSAGKSVYGELKLSERLADELNIVRDQVYRLKEGLEESNYLRDQYKRENQQLKAALGRKSREVGLLKH